MDYMACISAVSSTGETGVSKNKSQQMQCRSRDICVHGVSNWPK